MSESGASDANEPGYKVGTVINGHVWTGTTWVPVTNGQVPDGSGSRRGSWFRPKYVLGGWIAFALIVLLLGFIPNNVVQLVVSISWLFALVIALPATLLALALWLAGVGAQRPSSDGDT